jgi:glycosyltransferase involved in cell wall biosynthesis
MLNADWLYRGGPLAGAIWVANHAWNYLATKAVINAYRPDAVYIHNSENILAGPLNAAVGSGTRTVVHVHNHLYDQWAGSGAKLSLFGRLTRPRLEGATFIAVSRHMASELEKVGIPAARISTIHNGLPENAFKKEECPREEGTVVFAGHMAEHKGFHVFLQATAILLKERPGLRFEAWGHQPPGEYTERWKAYMRENLPGGAISINKPLHREELWRLFDRSDILLAPSLYPEAFGLVAAEAMCRGMIVVASNRGGLPEVVGDCGFIVEPTPEEVARACERALAMPAGKKEGMRRAARERAERHFRFEEQLPRYEAVLGASADS